MRNEIKERRHVYIPSKILTDHQNCLPVFNVRIPSTMTTISEILAKSASIISDSRLTRFRILIDDDDEGGEYMIREEEEEVLLLPPSLALRRNEEAAGGIWVRLRLSLLISFGDKFSLRFKLGTPPPKKRILQGGKDRPLYSLFRVDPFLILSCIALNP